MDLSGCHFVYADTSSRLYDLRFVNCNTAEYTSLNGKTKSITMFNSRGNRNYLISDSYEDSAISFSAEIITDDERPLTIQEIRDIEKWLFGRKKYYKLYVDIADDCDCETYEIIDGEEKRFYFNCRFINPSKIFGNGGTVGFNVTVECDSLLLWEDTISKTILSPSDSSPFLIEVNSDMNQYIYPRVTINMGSSNSDVTIINYSDDSTRITKFSSLTGNSSIIMDGNINYISGENYTKFLNKNFIRLLPGSNRIGVVGDVSSIIFEWENRKYL